MSPISTAREKQFETENLSVAPNQTKKTKGNGWMNWWRLSLAVVIAGTVLATSALAATDDSIPNDQSQLNPIINEGGKELKLDWPMIHIGTAEYKEGPTGVTVFRFGRKVLAAYGCPGRTDNSQHRVSAPRPRLTPV